MTDQAIARTAQKALAGAGIVALYAVLAVAEVLPAMPWSPLG